jgi:hypothetical protein
MKTLGGRAMTDALFVIDTATNHWRLSITASHDP